MLWGEWGAHCLSLCAQMLSLGSRIWVHDHWNILDSILLTVYWTGFLVRVARPASSMMQIAAKTVFAMNTIMLFARLTRYYAFSKTLGPKVGVAVVLFLLLPLWLLFTTSVRLCYYPPYGYTCKWVCSLSCTASLTALSRC